MTDTRSDPRYWHVSFDRDGFYVEDDYGEECLRQRWQTRVDAKTELDGIVANYLRGEVS